MRKSLLVLTIVILVVGGLSFYGGIKYEQMKLSGSKNYIQQFGGVNNISGQRARGFSGGFSGGGFIGGEVVSKDDKSITIKLRDGGSRIVFYSNSTEINKFVGGSVDDIEVGKNVSVMGKINSDGSIIADLIQIRPIPPVNNK
jgi:hypothetical protein